MKHQKEGSLLLGLIALLTVVIIVAVVGLLALRPEKMLIQGEAEAAEYRVSGKVPGRIEMYFFEEGESVKKGDTLVAIYSTRRSGGAVQSCCRYCQSRSQPV